METSTQRPRKVAFVSTMAGAAWGGSEELWSRTALRLRAIGHEVFASLFAWPVEPDPVNKLISAGVDVSFRARQHGVAGRLLEKCIQHVVPSPIEHGSMTWLQRQAPDLVVISQGWPWEGIPWMHACKELGLGYCPIIHAHGEHWWPPDEWLDDIRNAYGTAERVFFVSRANLKIMEMQCGMRFPHGEVVANPWNVDASRKVPWPKEDGTTQIACVGRLDPQAKGQDLLLRVLARPKWRQRPVDLLLYGNGPCRDSLESLCRLLSLRRVRFAGQVSDVHSIWAENHALILPSRYEGLPLVIVEAMLCGRPVITTDVGGNAEYLRDGITGFIADAPTERLLDEALERAWARRGEWESIGAQARKDVSAALPVDPVGRFAEKLLMLANCEKLFPLNL